MKPIRRTQAARQLAAHEAGHAVVASALGVAIEVVQVRTRADSRCLLAQSNFDADADFGPDHDIAVCLAGQMAERIHLRQISPTLDEVRADIAFSARWDDTDWTRAAVEAQWLIDYASRHDETIIETDTARYLWRVAGRVYSFLFRRWPDVLEVADAILESEDGISGERVNSIVRPASVKDRRRLLMCDARPDGHASVLFAAADHRDAVQTHHAE